MDSLSDIQNVILDKRIENIKDMGHFHDPFFLRNLKHLHTLFFYLNLEQIVGKNSKVYNGCRPRRL